MSFEFDKPKIPSLQLAPEVDVDDVIAVSDIYMDGDSAETSRFHDILRENSEFFIALRHKIDEIEPDPIRANAMMRGGVLIISAMKHHQDIGDLERLLLPNGSRFDTGA